MVKILSLELASDIAKLEEQVQLLWQASTEGHHIAHVYGVTCLDSRACLVCRGYPESLMDAVKLLPGDAELSHVSDHADIHSYCNRLRARDTV